MSRMFTVWADENIVEYTDDEYIARRFAAIARKDGAERVELWDDDGLIEEWIEEEE